MFEQRHQPGELCLSDFTELKGVTITINKNTKALIWKVEESLEVLSEGISLSAHCQNRIDLMKSDLHKRAFMSIRHLMALEGFSDHDLYYDEKGKPLSWYFLITLQTLFDLNVFPLTVMYPFSLKYLLT